MKQRTEETDGYAAASSQVRVGFPEAVALRTGIIGIRRVQRVEFAAGNPRSPHVQLEDAADEFGFGGPGR